MINQNSKLENFKIIAKRHFNFSFFILNLKFDRAKRENGFSLIFALLIVSIVASVGLSVFEIFFIELAMGGSIKESQHAFYAADSGVECVLYWDLKDWPPLSTTTSKSITCNNETKNVGGASLTTFQLNFSNGSCADVEVNIDNITGKRTITSLGKNICDPSFPRRTERGIEIIYD